jgi:hypothetical protein
MSKLFFDHLILFEEVDKKIKKVASSVEEKEELWGLIDEMVHHKAFDVILGKLPRDNHEEFLEMFHAHPHDEVMLFDYLKNKIDKNIEEILRAEFGNLTYEILKEFNSK